MAGEARDDVQPLPGFSFTVTLGDDTSATFQEMDGLESTAQPVEDRNADSPLFTPIALPGTGRVGNVTLRKGVFVNDARFWNWYSAIKLDTLVRRTVIITRLDERGTPTMTWTLNDAWPTRVTGTELTSEGNEVAVESVEVAFETLVIAAP